MNKIKKRLGFGCMRFPMIGEEVNVDETRKMIDTFMEAGFNYFDTAHGYIGKRSETVLRECLTSRYDRDSYVLTDKLSGFFFKSEEEIRPLFETQLEATGVDYFDFYLMHAQNSENFLHFKKCRAYEIAFELKKEGKIRHVGISFHDSASVLDRILTEYPEIEVVQIQLNYLDYNSPVIQSRLCYEVCEKHNKPVIIMEPVKGGNLVKLPEEAKAVFDSLGDASYASYAIRFAAGFPKVINVLSGMSDMAQIEDNIAYMKDFKPLNQTELSAIDKVLEIYSKMQLIPCTACQYCVDGCPAQISIPGIFAIMNSKQIYKDWNADFYYNTVVTKNGARASACIKCGKCEKICPQGIEIRKLLSEASAEFEKKG